MVKKVVGMKPFGKFSRGFKIAQVVELRGKSESTVWKQLNELTKKGIIEYRGSDKTGGILCEVSFISGK